jgi:hypothetical protein
LASSSDSLVEQLTRIPKLDGSNPGIKGRNSRRRNKKCGGTFLFQLAQIYKTLNKK